MPPEPPERLLGGGKNVLPEWQPKVHDRGFFSIISVGTIAAPPGVVLTPLPINELTSIIIAAAIAVHRALGPGLLESAYLTCLVFELRRRGLRVEEDRPLPLTYCGLKLSCGYRLDIIVEGLVIVEVKTVERFAPIHTAQLLTYLRLTDCPVGLLLNFNTPVLKQGIKRIINAQSSRALRADEATKSPFPDVL